MDSAEFSERGGLTWGPSESGESTYVWGPFAALRVSPQRLRFTVRLWKPLAVIAKLVWFDRNAEIDQGFELDRAHIVALRRRHAPFARGIVVEHRNAACPAYIVFWPTSYPTLLKALQQHGYQVVESPSSGGRRFGV